MHHRRKVGRCSIRLLQYWSASEAIFQILRALAWYSRIWQMSQTTPNVPPPFRLEVRRKCGSLSVRSLLRADCMETTPNSLLTSHTHQLYKGGGVHYLASALFMAAVSGKPTSFLTSTWSRLARGPPYQRATHATSGVRAVFLESPPVQAEPNIIRNAHHKILGMHSDRESDPGSNG